MYNRSQERARAEADDEVDRPGNSYFSFGGKVLQLHELSHLIKCDLSEPEA